MLLITKAVGALLTPPALFLLLALLGLLLQYRWRYLGQAMVSGSVLALAILSLPVTGDFLISTLEDSVEPLNPAGNTLQQRAGAIIVLGGGRAPGTPEYSGDTVSGSTLERLRYAARLHKSSRLPLLVSGGSPTERIPEAKLMHDVLTQDFAVEVAWSEERSRTTHENAVYSRPILDASGIHRVALVTHAWHMPRAVLAFRQAGIDVIPAPTIYTARDSSYSVMRFLPSGPSLSKSYLALHEWIGIAWYRVVYGAPGDPADSPAGSSASSAAGGR